MNHDFPGLSVSKTDRDFMLCYTQLFSAILHPYRKEYPPP